MTDKSASTPEDISVRVTAVEHDLQAVKVSLGEMRTETQKGFERIEKSTSDAMDKMFGLLKVVKEEQDSESRNIYRLTGELQHQVHAHRQVNWQLIMSAAAVLTGVIGLVGTAFWGYTHLALEGIRTEMILRDQVSVYKARFGSIQEEQPTNGTQKH